MIKINLLPKRVRIRFEILIQHFAVLLITLGLFFWALTYFRSRIDNNITLIDKEIKEINSLVAKLEKVVSEVKKTQEKKKYLESQLQIIETLYKNKKGPVQMLDNLSDIIPDDLWIISIKEEANKMELGGEAINQFIIADFLDNLKKARYFTNVEIGEISGSPNKKFSIKAETSYL